MDEAAADGTGTQPERKRDFALKRRRPKLDEKRYVHKKKKEK